MKPVSKNNPLKHYEWGNHCSGWNLVEQNGLSIKQEHMPPGTLEEWHHHKIAQQFFYILKGYAVMEFEEIKMELKEGEGIYVEAGKKHRIVNMSDKGLEFLLVSQPSTLGDRIPDEE
ncbi:MAG: cupin domain-containing protein [Bacteroidetes bacterium]|nr:MAG: cupin domain-containing protein [Bacteroidota bacterium]